LDLLRQDAGYDLWLAAHPGEFNESPGGSAGAFTSSFTQHLSESDPATLTNGQVLNAVIQKMKEPKVLHLGKTHRLNQTPLFVGSLDQQLFGKEELHLSVWNFAQRKNYAAFTLGDLKAQHTNFIRQVAAPFPQAHYSFGCAFLEKNNYAEAIDALKTALDQSGREDTETLLAQGKAQLGARRYADAAQTFELHKTARLAEQTQASSPEAAPLAEQTQALIELTKRLKRCAKHALLVGINDYDDSSVPAVRGAVNDVQTLKEVLITRFGFQKKNIDVLLNRDATRAAVLEGFKRLLKIARDEPALFYFAGNGSVSGDTEPTLVSADGRQQQVFDIELSELAALALEADSNLVTIIDAGWNPFPLNQEGKRWAPADARKRQSPDRGLLESFKIRFELSPFSKLFFIPRDMNAPQLRIGAVSIYANSIKFLRLNRDASESKIPGSQGADQDRIHGNLTYQLIQCLEKMDARDLSYQDWLKAASAELKHNEPVVLGEHLDWPLFAPRTLSAKALKRAEEIGRLPVDETIATLRRLIERDEWRAEGNLNLGLAYASIGEWDKSVQSIQTAVYLYDDPSIAEQERVLGDPCVEEHQRQARYHLGRVLFERKHELGKAVEELRKAKYQNPEDPRVNYYLGQAIRALVERESLAEAANLLQTYLDEGAPLGHEEEVQDFLRSRHQTTQSEAT
jgi:tetratricopeptide (TPR) repeat protein